MDSGTSTSTLFVFIDESGDMQFGPKASQHFVLSAVCLRDPVYTASVMQRLKYDLMAEGSEDLEFHATENTKGTRKRVVDTICGLDGLRVHTVWINKAFAAPNLQNEIELFRLFGAAMGRWVGKALVDDGDQQVIMIFDSVLTGKKRNAFLKKIKPILGELGVKYRVLFHPVKQDLNGQIADYFSWAAYRTLERQDSATEDRLKEAVHWDDFNLFQKGDRVYWRRPTK
ncbi:DUF3800 domain-containing protein [Corynebacterium genitalium ATCC 33030]|uniref:DUF3800 domain-containing protein n=1 Tax=Corynebacterium genitalium ATCC 33030 TaxID=585529 RepID=D7W984_9CORY|nr:MULTISPECIES: DUF3800 domain-containing protein [Corynebacterium]EFK55364.1 hypothetical protein HMPREF0291_10622 [Corynebacterium genitalium ATCC 33030]MCQ4620091.1 DUF3800 domain-containing protein [Corynebacterium sp. CCUG 71335]MCQ4623054.1 DUF3800 domain-containing protein [Corynebacterium sp. CCUG 70398]MCQ4626854.1 DUF3800 domain-containing protein [Corynebacterium sp. CCUG 65737]UUA89387.1 DUF3800 domain-containing protein [Corynebacterium genitalium ATCC 33030]